MQLSSRERCDAVRERERCEAVRERAVKNVHRLESALVVSVYFLTSARESDSFIDAGRAESGASSS